MTKERIKETHESYGMISFNRSRGGHPNLFGTSIEHNEKITLTISRGAVERDLSNDWFFAKGAPIIEVAMSHNQFAKAITSFGQGDGVPCTLVSVNRERMENCPFTNKRKQFESEMKAQMEEMQRKLDSLTAETKDILENKKSIGKGDREMILKSLSQLQMQLVSNVPYVLNQFNEQMDKTVNEAKMEVDAYTSSVIEELGLSKLKELQQLGQKNSPSNFIEE